jgi:hypothetical protein
MLRVINQSHNLKIKKKSERPITQNHEDEGLVMMIRGRNVTLYQYRIIISLVVVLLGALHLLGDIILLVQSVPSFLRLFTLGV